MVKNTEIGFDFTYIQIPRGFRFPLLTRLSFFVALDMNIRKLVPSFSYKLRILIFFSVTLGAFLVSLKSTKCLESDFKNLFPSPTRAKLCNR